MMGSRNSPTRLARATGGFVMVETSFMVLTLMMLVLLVTGLFLRISDMSGDARASQLGAELAAQFVFEHGDVDAADMDAIRGLLRQSGTLEPDELFRMIVSVFRFNTVAGYTSPLRVADGPATSRTSRAIQSNVPGAEGVHLDGTVYAIRDDEQMVVFELYKTSRGLDAYRDREPGYYQRTVTYAYDPDNDVANTAP